MALQAAPLDPERPATGMNAAMHIGCRLPEGRRIGLLVVDVTRGFTDPGSALACEMEGPVRAIARLLEVARAAGCPVAFTRVAYADELSPAAELFHAKVPALAGLRDGAASTEIDPRVEPQEAETVLRKELASAFAGTSLYEWVTGHGLDSLMVTGASTSGCVRATVVDALQHGLRALVPREAVGDRDIDSHSAALRDIDGRYGDVVSLDEALDRLSPTPVGLGGDA